MRAVRLLWHIMRADFLERSRRFSFLVCLGVTVYSAYLFVPPRDANYLSISIGLYRGVFNSAWVGASLAAMGALVLSLFGFYLIKDTLHRDRATGVGQIIASSSLRPWAYLAGKGLSNFACLVAMVGVVWLATIPIQLLRGEVSEVDLVAATLPFLLITLPVMAIVAAFGILFETVRWLRGSTGNVLYFILWGVGITVGRIAPGGGHPFDLMGLTPLYTSFYSSCIRVYSACEGALENAAAAIQPLPPGSQIDTFVWAGVHWTPAVVGVRLFWLGVAVALITVAVLLFGPFETALGAHSREERRTIPGSQPDSDAGPGAVSLWKRLASVVPVGRSVIASELKLMFVGISSWWVVGAVALGITGLLVPGPVARAWLLPIAWIWPLPLWSSMGGREAKWGVDRILFCTPRPISRQLPSAWTAGVIIAVITGIGPLLRMSLEGDWLAVSGWVVGALFIPSLALALGVWTSSERLFEIVYLVLWYLGPMEKMPLLDFTGAGGKGAPLVFVAITVILLAAAAIGRRRAVYG